jgi:hypothetical protein
MQRPKISPPRQCRRLATKAERLAAVTDDPPTKQLLTDLAARWRQLAEEDEASSASPHSDRRSRGGRGMEA